MPQDQEVPNAAPAKGGRGSQGETEPARGEPLASGENGPELSPEAEEAIDRATSMWTGESSDTQKDD